MEKSSTGELKREKPMPFGEWYLKMEHEAEARFAPLAKALEQRGYEASVWQTGGMVMCLAVRLSMKGQPWSKYALVGDPNGVDATTEFEFGVYDESAPDDGMDMYDPSLSAEQSSEGATYDASVDDNSEEWWGLRVKRLTFKSVFEGNDAELAALWMIRTFETYYEGWDGVQDAKRYEEYFREWSDSCMYVEDIRKIKNANWTLDETMPCTPGYVYPYIYVDHDLDGERCRVSQDYGQAIIAWSFDWKAWFTMIGEEDQTRADLRELERILFVFIWAEAQK